MKTSEILIEAKKYLAKDYAEIVRRGRNFKQTYICFAIDGAALAGKKRQALLNLINTRLGGQYATLETWLKAKHGIDRKDWSNISFVDYTTKMQETRHAWVDSMIAEFQSKGD